jgi:hypothetical protein
MIVLLLAIYRGLLYTCKVWIWGILQSDWFSTSRQSRSPSLRSSGRNARLWDNPFQGGIWLAVEMVRSSILARIPGFRQRIIPEPRVPSRGSQARGTRLILLLFHNLVPRAFVTLSHIWHLSPYILSLQTIPECTVIYFGKRSIECTQKHISLFS